MLRKFRGRSGDLMALLIKGLAIARRDPYEMSGRPYLCLVRAIFRGCIPPTQAILNDKDNPGHHAPIHHHAEPRARGKRVYQSQLLLCKPK